MPPRPTGLPLLRGSFPFSVTQPDEPPTQRLPSAGLVAPSHFLSASTPYSHLTSQVSLNLLRSWGSSLQRFRHCELPPPLGSASPPVVPPHFRGFHLAILGDSAVDLSTSSDPPALLGFSLPEAFPSCALGLISTAFSHPKMRVCNALRLLEATVLVLRA